MLVTLIATGLSAALLVASSASAQSESPDTEPRARIQADEEVIVRGRRLSELDFDIRDYIREFIDEVAAPARSRGYARWQRSVCVGVINLQTVVARYIVDRISSLALEAGLEPGEPDCRPQVSIVFVMNARETASTMVENWPRVFRPAGGNAGMDLGFEGMDKFSQSDEPVRWWHVSMPVDARTGAPAIRFPGHPPPTILKTGVSRLYNGIRDDLQYVIIVVDATKLSGTTWQQLADYLAFVSLVQVSPDADPSDFDSILNLFSNPAAYSGLTDWDLSYLKALYTFDQERDARLQKGEIVSLIAKREQSTAE